jgi:uncharacterized membrane protein YqhA
MFERLLTDSRYLILIAVIGSLVASVVLLIYGGMEVLYLTIKTLSSLDINAKADKSLVVAFVEMVDLFLLSAAFYMIALGLYALFINDQLRLPDWLVIHNFDDLKSKLISVIIVVMGVLFLSQLVNWDGQRDILGFGAAIALVTAALAYFLSVKGGKSMPAAGEKD